MVAYQPVDEDPGDFTPDGPLEQICLPDIIGVPDAVPAPGLDTPDLEALAGICENTCGGTCRLRGHGQPDGEDGGCPRARGRDDLTPQATPEVQPQKRVRDTEATGMLVSPFAPRALMVDDVADPPCVDLMLHMKGMMI